MAFDIMCLFSYESADWTHKLLSHIKLNSIFEFGPSDLWETHQNSGPERASQLSKQK